MSVMDKLSIAKLAIDWDHRLPMILQIEASECGLACLAMVAHYHGQHNDLASLRRRYGMSLKGATLKEVIRIADEIGLATRPLRLELDDAAQLRLPCILHWDLNHFVVLKSVSRTGVVVHDPATGIRRLTMAEFSRHFTGVALELTPTTRFQPVKTEPRLKVFDLVSRVTGLKRSLGHLLVMALAIELFAMLSPLFLAWVVDDALVTADSDLLLTLVLGFLLLVVLQITVSTMRGWMLMGLNASLKVQSRANLFAHLISLPASFFDARHLGDVMSRFGSQEVILQSITTELIEAALDGLMTVITLAIMLFLAPGLTVVVVAGAAIYAAIRWLSYLPLRQASGEAIVWAARRDSHFLETMRGIRTIKLFNGQDERRVHWLNLLVETVNRQLTTEKLRIAIRAANGLVLGVLKIVVVWLAASRVLDGTFTVGLLLAFLAYKDQFLSRISALVDKGVELRMLGLHAERLADIVQTEPEPRGPRSLPSPRDHQPAGLELRDISFRYSDNEPWILDNVSLKIDAGSSVVIIGASGCGKTTLLKILCGLLQPTKGQILVNGEPLARIGLESYRRMIGTVMQDDQLFAGSIADNIAFFADQPDTELIEDCATMASVHDDIRDMPMGYGTLIGDMGTVLSGGQKQRVLIARALYRWPAILMLDEATSHLDIARERAVAEALRVIDMTRIAIAHRPETIFAHDRAITLERGKIVGDATTLSLTAARRT